MDWMLQALAVVGMFIVRLGIPVAITLAVGYWLRHLDAKWQAEAMAHRATELANKQVEEKPELEIYKIITPPCWVTNSCPESTQTQCPARQFPDSPCWLTRYRTEGRLSAKCYHCKLFAPRQREITTHVGGKSGVV